MDKSDTYQRYIIFGIFWMFTQFLFVLNSIFTELTPSKPRVNYELTTKKYRRNSLVGIYLRVDLKGPNSGFPDTSGSVPPIN
jgi:hypothetical protein